MKLLITLSSLLLFTITATSTLSENEFAHKEPTTPIAINDIVIYEVEEEADICFDTEKYLPENFNALKGKYDIDWSKMDLVDEPEDELEFDFDTKAYLPENFNALKGSHDIDWSKIDLVNEPEEELVFDFNTKDYLPEGFDAHKTVAKVKSSCKFAGL